MLAGEAEDAFFVFVVVFCLVTLLFNACGQNAYDSIFLQIFKECVSWKNQRHLHLFIQVAQIQDRNNAKFDYIKPGRNKT